MEYHGSDVAGQFTNKYLALKVEERRKMNDSLYGELRAVNRKHFYEIWIKAQKGDLETLTEEEKHLAHKQA